MGKYLVDDTGQIQYLVDPGIAGVVTEVNGKHVTKLDSPKARLFSLIIDGILTRKLPWGLVLIGVFLAPVCGGALFAIVQHRAYNGGRNNPRAGRAKVERRRNSRLAC